MAIQTSDFDFDPFAKAIPGQSFTDTPGKRPFETVPQTSSPQQALDAVKQSLEDPIAMKTTIKLLDAGSSILFTSLKFLDLTYSPLLKTSTYDELKKYV